MGTSELVVEGLQRDALDDVQGVDHVAQTLGHLAAMRVPHHVVQVHRVERHLACTTSGSYWSLAAPTLPYLKEWIVCFFCKGVLFA